MIGIARILAGAFVYMCVCYGFDLHMKGIGFGRSLAIAAVMYPCGCVLLKLIGVRAF